MTVDSKEQQKMLVNILNGLQVNGNLVEAKNTIEIIEKLIEAVQTANIEKQDNGQPA